MSTNQELADWVLRFPEEEMVYYCVAINGCGAIALSSTSKSSEETNAMKDAFEYALFALENHND